MPKKKTENKSGGKKQRKRSRRDGTEENDDFNFETAEESGIPPPPPLPRIGQQSPPPPVIVTEENVDSDVESAGGGSDLLTPEQQQMAQFWAEEELNGPRGWEEEAELNYSQPTTGSRSLMASSPFVPILGGDSRPPQGDASTAIETSMQAQGSISETPSLFNYSQSLSYELKYLGQLNSVSAEWIQSGAPADLLKLIELSQRQGRLPWVPYAGCERLMFISKYGLKVTDINKKRVYMRQALHNMVSVVHYQSTQKTSLLAVRTSKGAAENFDLSLFECESEDQASDICSTLAQAFDAVLTKIRLEQNLSPLEFS